MDKCLKPYNINVISLWPGLVRTEIMEKVHETIDFVQKAYIIIKNNWHLSESTFLTGRAILALATGLVQYYHHKTRMWHLNLAMFTLSQI
ncbi:LOW QUALITY PROTEIN: hypothetical protein HZS_6488 [Henneguya salminicola]|nr:LOW QUALITY PROTEIN: hypothetical protein HZS_6488 [Henneguya salminicola]